MKPEEEPLRPEAAAIVNHRRQSPLESPFTQCLPGGIPATLLAQTFKIIQTPQEIVMLPEILTHPARFKPNGRPLRRNPDQSGWEYPVDIWKEDSLVLASVGMTAGASSAVPGI